MVLEQHGQYVLLTYLPDDIETIDIGPVWYLPLSRDREGQARPLVVEVLFGPTIPAAVALSVTPLINGDVDVDMLTAARDQLLRWRKRYCRTERGVGR